MTMFLSECCTFCTILHITFLSLERYLAVCWPITAKTVVTRRRTRTIIGCLWLGAAVSAAPVLVMVGVEEVGAEELGLLWEVEQGGLPVSGEERGGTHMALVDGGFEAIKFGGEKEIKGWGTRVEEFKWFEGEHKLGGEKERKQGAKSGVKDEKQVAEESSEEKAKTDFEGDQQNKKKEDEGGGKEESIDASQGPQTDRRECRCTDFAISSGLLSAMMILSNLYFLVPLSILGLVYSLIGRTLWLRPKSSRRDQSHRNTVKMLGVIVLAFVLCWMPFHVGRTIFSLSLGADRQETHADTNPHLNTDTLADVSTDNLDLDVHGVPQPFSHSRSDTRFFESVAQAGDMTARPVTDTDTRLCGTCADAKVKIDTRSSDTDAETRLNSRTVTKTELQNVNTDTSAKNLHPNTETNTHAELRDSAPVNTKHGNRNQNLGMHESTNTITHETQNRTRLSITALDVLSSHLPPASSTNTYSAGLTHLYMDGTTNDTHFNSTHPHPDTHMYFLYYLSQYFNLVSSVLFYLSAAVNPLLYNLMSARYRLAVRSLVHRNSQNDANRLRSLTARHSTTTL